MTAYHAICLRDHTVEGADGVKMELKRGKQYTVSAPRESQVHGRAVTVFSNYWVAVPASLFGGFATLSGDEPVDPVDIIEVPPPQDRAVGSLRREAFLAGWREGWKAGRTQTMATIIGAAPSAPTSADESLKAWVSYYEGDLRS